LAKLWPSDGFCTTFRHFSIFADSKSQLFWLVFGLGRNIKAPSK